MIRRLLFILFLYILLVWLIIVYLLLGDTGKILERGLLWTVIGVAGLLGWLIRLVSHPVDGALDFVFHFRELLADLRGVGFHLLDHFLGVKLVERVQLLLRELLLRPRQLHQFDGIS